jgi:hypothetical protein
MNNRNDDVENGIANVANGTTSTFVSAQLKAGVKLQPIQMHGYWVNAVSVNDVDYLELNWQESSQVKGKFCVFPESGPFKVSFPTFQ